MNRPTIEIGIDGDCGYAMLGNNIQEDPSVFIKIANTGHYQEDLSIAISTAVFQLLNDELTKDEFQSTFYDPYKDGGN